MLNQLQQILENAKRRDLTAQEARVILDHTTDIKLTHSLFTSEEWVRGLGPGMYIYEDGVTHHMNDFWHMRQDNNVWGTGWRLFDKKDYSDYI